MVLMSSGDTNYVAGIICFFIAFGGATVLIGYYLYNRFFKQFARMPKKPENKDQLKKEKSSWLKNLCVTILAIGCIGFGTYTMVDIFSNKNETPNPIVQIIKEEPTLNAKVENDSIVIIVNAKDDYNSVTVLLLLYNSNSEIISRYKLIGTNYKKGKSYQMKQKITIDELLYATQISYKCIDYR